MEHWANFLIELSAGLLGVFAGAALALWADRRVRERHAAEERARLEEDLANSRKLVISSVVKNTSETKRLGRLLEEEDDDPYLFHVGFESAVWEATRAQFIRIASADERVLLTRFFDNVRRLGRLIEFHRKVRADMEIRNSAPDAGDHRLLNDLRERLREVAGDIRLDGLVIVTDLGDEMHHRLLGIKRSAENPDRS